MGYGFQLRIETYSVSQMFLRPLSSSEYARQLILPPKYGEKEHLSPKWVMFFIQICTTIFMKNFITLLFCLFIETFVVLLQPETRRDTAWLS
jgi:hypothetical protein